MIVGQEPYNAAADLIRQWNAAPIPHHTVRRTTHGWAGYLTTHSFLNWTVTPHKITPLWHWDLDAHTTQGLFSWPDFTAIHTHYQHHVPTLWNSTQQEWQITSTHQSLESFWIDTMTTVGQQLAQYPPLSAAYTWHLRDGAPQIITVVFTLASTITGLLWIWH